jgi:hypothetical protein
MSLDEFLTLVAGTTLDQAREYASAVLATAFYSSEAGRV